MVVSQNKPSRDVPTKTTLFCPDCDYRSRIGGDWHVVETTRTVRYLCPDCETEIAVRPTFTSRTGQHASAMFLQPWMNSIHVWVGFWSHKAAVVNRAARDGTDV